MFDSPVLDDPPAGAGFPVGAGEPDLDAWPPAGWPGRPPDLPDPPPPDYGAVPPSGLLALDLDVVTTEPAALSDATLIEAMVGLDRVAAWALARQARLLVELGRRRPPDPVPDAEGAWVGSRFVPDEVGVALTLARGTAAYRIGMAERLLATLPATAALWEAGRIDTTKARAIHDATVVLPDALAVAVEARVLPRAPGQTLAQLRAALARAILAVDPEGADARHVEARRGRRVVVQPEADGMASLWALLTATDAAGAHTWLTRLARGLGPDDPRSMDARRADLLAALLNGRLVVDGGLTLVDTPADEAAGAPTSTATDARGAAAEADGRRRPVHPVTPGRPLIQVVVDRATLAGVGHEPADLVGHGPIPPALAREVAADGVWRRLVTDPLSGTVLDCGRTTYHPPAGLADHVRARDRYCRFPGCRRRAVDAELDHALAWADGGETSAANLFALCGTHHRLKHHAGWRVHARPDGRLTWTTPTGHRHTTAPHDHRPGTGPPGGSAVADSAVAGRPAPTEGDPDPPPF